ncbi:sensor histidine kinase [Ferruginibacter sp. SUN106]|uniref:sensor histidine kinase n=1 Tax=Ferruginibacter sp. SUN106 TaxID=2978348 RepID=UPI003D36503A
MKAIEKLSDLYIKNITLKEKLVTYKKIAWSNDAYQRRRVRYYMMLYDNCLYTYRPGVSFYYVEKAEEERKKIKGYVNSLFSLVAIIYNYGRTASGRQRCIEEYNRYLPFLQQLPQKIITDSVPRGTLMNSTSALTDIADFYLQLKDTANALKACVLSENIRNSWQRKRDIPDSLLYRPTYNYYLAQYFKKRILHQPDNAKKMLDSAYAIAYAKHMSYDYIWREAVRSDMCLYLFDFFIGKGQTDSAAFYLQQMRERQDNAVDNLSDGTVYLYNYSILKASEKDYRAAYQNLKNAYDINDSIIGIKIADINNNMYAQTLAEAKTEELQKAQQLEQKRNVLIGIISAISLIVILFLYLRIRIKDKAAKERISKLNYTSQLQIMELEERSFLIKQEEQKKLGMDLHDGLAGTIAAAKIQVESELINNHNKEQVERLKNIAKLMTDIYESTREKSRLLYNGQANEMEITFSKRIRLIIENSITADKYKIVIEVDDELMKEVSLEIKIQLLYIIQEAITNIIKYAFAKNICILIYDDSNEIVLQVLDDGKGFNVQSKKGIGLNSIRDRATALNGTSEIVSGNEGTEITVSIPTEF